VIFQAIKSAWPGQVDEGGADREWNCLLACGHERKLFGSRSPRQGRAFAACELCEARLVQKRLDDAEFKEATKQCSEFTPDLGEPTS
jgi:hypothetical protein